MDNLKVAEHFYSIQGEGLTTGVPAYFIRLTSCNLLCGGYGTQKDGLLHDGATWRCDTIEVWTKGKEMTPIELLGCLGIEFIDRVKGGAHIIFTGGEPLLQQKGIEAFLKMLMPYFNFGRPFVEVETNGTVLPSDFMFANVDQWNISPKLSNSGMPKDKRIVPAVLQRFNACAFSVIMFKFVVSSETDWDEICIDYSMVPHRRIVLMPAAMDEDELRKNINIVAELAKKHCIRMCSRMHITIWNKLTGV